MCILFENSDEKALCRWSGEGVLEGERYMGTRDIMEGLNRKARNMTTFSKEDVPSEMLFMGAMEASQMRNFQVKDMQTNPPMSRGMNWGINAKRRF